MLQGLIYEKGNDINNAFIAYRNAADVYLKNDGSYYGTKMPEQLKKEDELQYKAAHTDDYKEGVNAFMEKRQPVFRGK